MQSDDDYEDQDRMMIDDEKSVESSKNVRVSTRKEEEDRLLQEYAKLAALRTALQNAKEAADYQNTPQIIADEKRLEQAFILHEIKAKQLRDQAHPAMDLRNNEWNNDPYWK